MVVWQVEPECNEEVGKILAEFKEASHVYKRQAPENWPYNVYTMVHGGSIQEARRTTECMSKACGISSYRVLVTEKELKKVPPTYITQ